MRFAAITTSTVLCILVGAIVAPHAKAQPPVDWHLTYDLRPGRVFGYVFLMQETVGTKTEYLGGTVLFKSVAKDGTGRAPNRLAIIDNLKVATVYSPELIEPQLPTSNLFLPESVFVNTFHGDRPTADGDLPRMLGDTTEWFFPPLPAEVGDKCHKEGYLTRSRNVRIPSYFHYDSVAVSESRGLVRVKDKRSLQANDGMSLDVQGTSVWEFDTNSRLMQRRTMKGVHKVRGMTMFVNIQIEKLSAQQMKTLARRPLQRGKSEDTHPE